MKTTLGKGALYLSISSIILMLVGYIVNIFLGRTLGPAEYGTYGILISLVTAVNLMQTAGLPQAVSKFIAENDTHANSILKSGLIIQIISTLVMTCSFFLLANPLALLLHDQRLVSYIQLASLIFPFYGIFAFYTGYYNGLHNFKRQAYLNIIFAIVKLIAVIGLVFFFHLFGIIWGLIIAPFVAFLFGLRLPKQTLLHFSYKRLIVFSLPLIGLAIFSNLLQSIDLFFIKSLLQDNALTGFYTANQNIAEIPFFAITSLAAVLLPGISKSVSQNRYEQTQTIITKFLWVTLLLLLPSIFFISATSKELITFLYSSAYQAGSASLAILAIGSCFFTIFIVLTMIMSGAGSPRIAFYLSAAGLLLNAVLCAFFIPTWKLEGAALATSVTAFLVMIISFIWLYKKFHVFLPMKSLLKISIASFIVSLLTKLITIPIATLPLFYIFLFLCYFLLLYFMKEISKDDFILAKSFLPDWIRRRIHI
jgi:stage V sporulation protein B